MFETDPALAAVVLELETHAASVGWDQPATLYALVDTASFIANEPTLASLLGLTDDPSVAGTLTPIEQDQFSQPLEVVLPTIGFGESVKGVAVVVERPEGEYEQARVVVGVTRSGASYCAMRSRTHDAAEAVASSEDLVPELIDMLRAVLENDVEDDK